MKHFVILLVLIGVAFTPNLFPDVFSMCVLNEDWPNAPCFSGRRGMDPSMNQMKQSWAPYYEFKGAEWMESKKQELIQTIQNGTLIDWKKGDPNRTHNNVYMYYFLKGDIPNEDGLFAKEYYGVKYLSPLHQREFGIELNDIHCGMDLILVQKYDDSPACVSRSTHWSLIERSWAKTDSDTQSIIQKAKVLGISNVMDAIDSSDLSAEEKEQFVDAKYRIGHDGRSTLNLRIKDLPSTIGFGERPTFNLIETGYANPCTSPKLEVYYLKQEIGNDHTDDDLVYEDQLVYRCISVKELKTVLNIWDDSRFKPMPVCEEEGRFLIVGDSGYERIVLDSYICMGKSDEN